MGSHEISWAELLRAGFREGLVFNGIYHKVYKVPTILVSLVLACIFCLLRKLSSSLVVC